MPPSVSTSARSLGGPISVGGGFRTGGSSGLNLSNQTFSLPQGSQPRVMGTGGPTATGGSIGLDTFNRNGDPTGSFSFTRDGNRNIFSGSVTRYNNNGSSFTAGGSYGFSRTSGPGFVANGREGSVFGSYSWRNGNTTQTLGGDLSFSRTTTRFQGGRQFDNTFGVGLNYRNSRNVPLDQSGSLFRTREFGLSGRLDLSRSSISYDGYGSVPNGYSNSLSAEANYFNGITNANRERLSGYGLSIGASRTNSNNGNGYSVNGRADVYFNGGNSVYLQGGFGREMGAPNWSVSTGVNFRF